MASFKNNGMKLNILAASIVTLGFLTAIAIKISFDIDMPTSVGMLCGAVTNTPSLGAAQSLISDQLDNGAALAQNTGMAYAIAYPFGIIGIIVTMYMVRYLFRIDVNDEIKNHKNETEAQNQKTKAINIVISNTNLSGKNIGFLKKSLENRFVFSRISRDGDFLVPDKNEVLHPGDIIYGLALEKNFPELEMAVGKVSITPKYEHSEPLAMRHIIITNRSIAGKKINDIRFSELFPASITRIFRGDTEIIASPSNSIEFGDTVRVIGARDKMDEIANFLGNSVHSLAHPNIIPLFIGILLGILLGSIPVFIPGLPAPAKLGLAGGPLVIALLLGHKGRIGKLDFYMTPGANKYIRELGIILFLACVGIGSGKHFWETLTDGGLRLMGLSALITFVPLFVVAIAGRLLKLNYLTICGMLSGSMTDPPALEFANSIAPGQAQSGAYAMVYPLTMFLRILFAQIFVLLFV
jgi:putative transport protein